MTINQISIFLENKYGTLNEMFAAILAYFTNAGLSIEYMYCFSSKEKSMLVLRTNNCESALDVIRKQNLNCITKNNLMNL